MGSNVENVKQRLDIVEVISPYLKIEKAGVNFKARCPFHNEKTPSFLISPSRQTYYCFGCGAKGDIFTFVEEMEGLDFREALRLLADKAGVVLERDSGGEKDRSEREKLLAVLEEAASYFSSEFLRDKQAGEYLSSRGLNKETITTWRLGLAPDEGKGGWRALYQHLASLGFAPELILKAGLAKRSEEKKGTEPYDVFRGRIMFPLKDAAGRIVGFSGRALSLETVPKYLNSPDTPLFNKSELLYGLDMAKEEIRRKNYAVLVEGQIDLLLSHQSGVRNTVASSGTAFTRSHLERLGKLSSRIILAFDGDGAGEKAAEKSAELGLSLGMEVKVARLPEGKDPADLILEDKELWRSALKDAKHAIEHFLLLILEREKDKRKAGKLIEKKILPLIVLLRSSIERAHFVSLVSKLSGIKEDVIWDDLRRVPSEPEASHSTAGEKKANREERGPARLPRRTNIERKLIGLIFWQKDLASEARSSVDVSTLEGEIVKRASEEYLASLKKTLEPERDVLVFEAESYYANPEKILADVGELLVNFEDDILRERLDGLIAQLSRAEAVKDDELIRQLSEEIKGVNESLRALEEKRKIM